MLHKLLTLLCLIASLFLLQGCYENVGSTLHEPGQYKGPNDPLLARMKTSELQEQLDQRFKSGQYDR